MNERIIKFRAWHKEAKVMLRVGDNFRTTHPLDCAVYARQGQDVVLMQFTGETYSDGTEVYEDDIYEYDYEYDSDYDGDMPIVKQSSGRGVVKDLTDTYAIRRAKQEGGKVRVIGNIHEHPNLI